MSSSWTRRAQGRPARPSEREQWLNRTWLAVQASRRRAEAEAAEQRRLRELPAKQAELIARYDAMDRDPYTQQIRAEAAQARARRSAEAARLAARVRDERAAEERAREILRAEYGWDG